MDFELRITGKTDPTPGKFHRPTDFLTYFLQAREAFPASYCVKVEMVEVKPTVLVDEYVVAKRDDAERVMELLRASIKSDGYATVGLLKDLLGLVSNYASFQIGWKSLNDAKILQVREGWLLNLPPAQEIA